jgi:hypothetical protein
MADLAVLMVQDTVVDLAGREPWGQQDEALLAEEALDPMFKGGWARGALWWEWVGGVVGCGLWAVGCGLWAVGCGLWAVGCGLWAVGWRLAGWPAWLLALHLGAYVELGGASVRYLVAAWCQGVAARPRPRHTLLPTFVAGR